MSAIEQWEAWARGDGRCPHCEGLPMADFEAICDCDCLARETGTAIPSGPDRSSRVTGPGQHQSNAPNVGAQSDDSRLGVGSGVAAMTYAMDTYLTPESGPFSCGMVAGAALCTDGKVRKVRFQNGGVADTFFSIPASVKVSGKTVSGYVTVETVDGYSTPTDDDPAVVRFVAYTYGRNGALLPGVR